jgi:hypothetical protein
MHLTEIVEPDWILYRTDLILIEVVSKRSNCSISLFFVDFYVKRKVESATM